MTTRLESTGTANLVHVLPGEEVSSFLMANSGPVIVDISADWCVPCRMLGPILRKASLEFEVPLVIVDSDSAGELKKSYGIKSIPYLLFFQDGELICRNPDYSDPEEIHEIVAKVFGRSLPAMPSNEELAFRDAYKRANLRFEELMTPPCEAIDPHLKAIEPELASIQASLDIELRAGRITQDQAKQRLGVERNRLYAPFQALIDQLRAVQSEACVAYELIMSDALEAFGRGQGGGQKLSQITCLLGDTSCTID